MGIPVSSIQNLPLDSTETALQDVRIELRKTIG